MIVDGIDITKLKRPKHPGEKPRKPALPRGKATTTKKVILWKTSAKTKKFSLIETLKEMPSDVDLDKLKIWQEGLRRTNSIKICIGYEEEVENPHYVKRLKAYEEMLDNFKIKLDKWNKDYDAYKKDLNLWNKYGKLAELIKDSKGLSSRLEKVDRKISKKRKKKTSKKSKRKVSA